MDFKGTFFNTKDFELTDKKLGSGSFGKVYVVRNIVDNKEYAAKIINVGEDFNGLEQIQFLQESMILRNLHHSSIVQFYGINLQSFNDPTQLSPTIITEYLPYGSLKQILDKEKKSIADKDWTPTKKYISLLGISHAMKYLHKNGILHRDLKPENVLIDENYYPRVCDFGLSKCFPESLTKSMRLTLTNNIGTPMYMAPEILEDNEENYHDFSVDIYAFGILAYEIITGKEPYSELGKIRSFSLATKILSGYRPPFTSDVPKKMKLLISRCLSQKPEERPTFDEIFNELSNDFSYFNDDVDEDEINEFIENLYEEDIIKKSGNKQDKILIKKLEKQNNELIEKMKIQLNSFESVKISTSINSIEDNAFNGSNSLIELIVPPSVESIGENSFKNCSKLERITIDPYQTQIKLSSFKNCKSLTTLILNSSVNSIKQFDFNKFGNISQIILPSSVTSIKSNGFKDCSFLKEILIPNSVKSIGKFAFKNCISLKYLFFYLSLTSIESNAFQGCKSLVLIAIPKSISIELNSSTKVVVNQNDSDALFEFALMLINGKEVPVDKEEGIKYLKLAIDEGNDDAKDFYENMKSTKKIDIKKYKPSIKTVKDKDVKSITVKGKDVKSTTSKDKDVKSKTGKDKDVKSTTGKDKDVKSTTGKAKSRFNSKSLSRSDALFLVKVYESSGLYEEMFDAMKYVINLNGKLNSEERDLLFNTSKNVTKNRMDQIHMIDSIIDHEKSRHNKDRVTELMKYKEKIYLEIENHVNEFLYLIEKIILPSESNEIEKRFYYKFKADLYRYLCHIKPDDKKINVCEKSYLEGIKISKDFKVSPANPEFLGLMLNYTVFLYEIQDKKEQAFQMLNRTFNTAVDLLDELSDDEYSEAVLILQLCKDNIALWNESK